MTDSSQSTSIAPAARVSDLVTIGLLVMAIWWSLVGRPVSLFSGLRDFLSPFVLVYVAVCVQIVRHLMWPRPSALARLGDLRAAIVERPHLATALRAFVMTRPAVFVVAYAAVITIGVSSSPGFILSREPLDNLPARFDAGWYGGIALDGYYWDHTFQRQRNIAFFPALPLLMRPVGAVLGMYEEGPSRERRMLRALWAGVVISLVAFFWALHYTSRLATDLIGPERAPAAALLLAAYPFAAYFNAPYTESLFLLASTGACFHFLRREWFAASAWGILVGLTRPNGCFLAIPLALLALQSSRRSLAVAPFGPKRAKAEAPSATKDADRPFDVFVPLTVAGMPGVGMLLFTLYLYHLTGVWFAWAHIQEAWGRSYEGLPLVTFFSNAGDQSWLQFIQNNPYNSINALGVLFALTMIYPVFRKVGLAWGVLVLINLLPPLITGGFLSLGRMTSTLFPLFFAFAAVIPPRAVTGWVAAFAIGQGLCATLFFTWRALF
jgi:hypothetical protein